MDLLTPLNAQWCITLEDRMPMSMNEREGLLMRKQGWQVWREKAEVLEEVQEAKQRLGIPEASGPRRVTVRFRKGYRTRKRDDPGNRYARTKSVLDAMVKVRLLIDDDDPNLTLRVVEEKGSVPAKQGPATIIEISDID